MFLGTSMLWKKQLIDWRRTNGSTLIVLIERRSTVDSSSMRKAMKDGAGSKWRPAMKITIQITVESDDGQLNVAKEVAHLDRGTLRPETLGLTLAEARSILAGLEQTVVEQQAAEFMAQREDRTENSATRPIGRSWRFSAACSRRIPCNGTGASAETRLRNWTMR